MGVGATYGPLIMALYIGQQGGWREGYATISYIQIALVGILFLTLPLWKLVTNNHTHTASEHSAPITNMMALKISGVKVQLLMFFCYCALEATTGLWATSFLILELNVLPSDATFWTAMYFLGITLGRFSCGFIADSIDEDKIITAGVYIIFMGVILLLLPSLLSQEHATSFGIIAKVGLVLIGLGCAPIYPNTIHLTPHRFDKNASQAIIGLSMAFAYVGTTLMPPLIGLLATSFTFLLLPVSLLLLTILMLLTTKRLKALAT
ncbi:MFS transporter [Psychromonas sp. KJ10-10]|uniref:MFS transporter n=1 Tax=Psychromonas sp. KJ10-10 TaxID=3391823 RepID=UPI0039B4F81B